MLSESLPLSFLSIVLLISFFVTLVIQKISSKIGNGILLDQDFDKPQSFHQKPIARSGCIAALISLMVFIIMYYLLFGRILNDYIFLSTSLFLIGFVDDIKFKTNPKFP